MLQNAMLMIRRSTYKIRKHGTIAVLETSGNFSSEAGLKALV